MHRLLVRRVAAAMACQAKPHPRLAVRRQPRSGQAWPRREKVGRRMERWQKVRVVGGACNRAFWGTWWRGVEAGCRNERIGSAAPGQRRQGVNAFAARVESVQ